MNPDARVAYLDSSALVKLVIEEAESSALRTAVSEVSRLASSDLSIVEVLRDAGRRGGGAEALASRLLRGLALRRIDRRVLLLASRLEPQVLRSLDAIHLATALTIGRDLVTLYTYDHRLRRAATAHGVPTAAPA